MNNEEMLRKVLAQQEQILSQNKFIIAAVGPLAKGYKLPVWMSAEEVKELLGIKDRRLRELKASGRIDYRQPAGSRAIQYRRHDVEAYMDGKIIINTKPEKTIH